MSKSKAPIGRRKFLKTASLAGAAVLSARVAKAQEPVPTTDPMPDPETGAAPVSGSGIGSVVGTGSCALATRADNTAAPARLAVFRNLRRPIGALLLDMMFLGHDAFGHDGESP